MPRLLRKLGRMFFGGNDLKNVFQKPFLNRCLQKNLLRDAKGGEQDRISR